MQDDHKQCPIFSHTYPAQPSSAAQARAALADVAAAAGADQRQVDAVRLAVSEAVTNAILHAYRGKPGQVHVTAAVVSQELWVLIADDGCGMEPASDRPGLGLGLGLIAQLSDHMAIVPRATGGTEVQVRFDLVTADLTDEAAMPEAGAKGRRTLV